MLLPYSTGNLKRDEFLIDSEVFQLAYLKIQLNIKEIGKKRFVHENTRYP